MVVLTILAVGCGAPADLDGGVLGGGGGAASNGGGGTGGGGIAAGGGSGAGGTGGGGIAAGGGNATGGGSATGGGTGGGTGAAAGGGTGGALGGGGGALGGGGGSTIDAGCVLTSCGGSPDVAGPWAVSHGTRTLSEPGGRTIALSTFKPFGAPVGPVVIIHPGFQLAGSLYTSYADHLASRGMVVIIADPPDALVGGPTQAELGRYLQDVISWVASEATDGGFVGAADPSMLGLAGHSMGGKISLLVATTDARPRAVFAIDPVDSAGGPLTTPGPNYPSVTPELMASIHVPLALVGETTNATCAGGFCQACAPAAENFAQYATHATSPTVSLEVMGANHMSFLDNPTCGFTCSACGAGTDDPTATRRFTRRSMTAFFDLELRGDSAARDWLAGAAIQPELADGGVRLTLKNGF